RRRHDRRPGARDRRRRDRHRPSRRRLDRARRHAGERRARGRRPAHRLARAPGVAARPGRERGGPPAAGGLLRGSRRQRLPLARIRRPPSGASLVLMIMEELAAPTLSTLAPTRRQILESLKKRGELTADDLADQLQLTTSGVRQHLVALTSDGLVAHRQVREGPGRPRHCYHLTAAADALFPRAYSDLTNELLGYASDDDPALVERLFERRRKRRVEDAKQRLTGKDFPHKVEELARILDEDGYLGDFQAQPDGS